MLKRGKQSEKQILCMGTFNYFTCHISLYGFNMILIQDGLQYEYIPNYMAELYG